MGCDSSASIKDNSPLSNQPFLTLNSKYKIPQYGLGVYQIEGDEATEKACLEAFKIGIRHIDTAHAYENERGVGAAIKKVISPEINFLLHQNYGFPIMEKELPLKQLIKCLKD